MFPTGVITREIEVGPASDLQSGVPYEIRVLLSPTRSLVWGETGVPVISKLKTYIVPPGQVATIELPVTDQEGYETGNGAEIVLGPEEHAFGYKISMSYLRNGSVVRKLPGGTFVLPEGDDPIDIDELVTFSSGNSGQVISTPDKWTAQVTAAQEAAEAAADSAAEAEAAIAGLEGSIDTAVTEWFEANPDSVVSPIALELAIQEHKDEATPHKAYDLDIPSLTVLFENGLV